MIAASLATLAAPHTALSRPLLQGTRVSGIVQSVLGPTVTLADGTDFDLADSTQVTLTRVGSAADLGPGQFLAITATREPDGALFASTVNIFPESDRGRSEGQRPMEGENIMTNATIDDAMIDAVSGAELTVSFFGETSVVRLGPETQVNVRSTGTIDDIGVGSRVTAVVTDGLAESVTVQ